MAAYDEPSSPNLMIAATGVPAAAAAPTGCSLDNGHCGTRCSAVSSLDPKHCYTFCGSIQFSSPRSAAVATKMLESKPEITSDRVSAVFAADGASITINVAAAEREELQAAVASLYSLIAIIPKDISSTSR